MGGDLLGGGLGGGEYRYTKSVWLMSTHFEYIKK